MGSKYIVIMELDLAKGLLIYKCMLLYIFEGGIGCI